ncbi:alpha/beta hydrolase [Sphingobium sp. AN641]|uniref:alpha/beta fold hydrolase n=1 Tax=Sphingobium sp. AN641 TaxID=3133443 RepID=UPI0030BE4C50
MTHTPPLEHHPRPDGLRLAYRHRRGSGPTMIFLPGYRSDMEGGKALALDAWAARSGRAMLRFDYGGHGASDGRFEDGTLASWRDDALLMIDAVTQGPILLVGSSMGGWLALLIALARPDRVVGLVGIAAAADFTQWGFTPAEKTRILEEGRLLQPSDYSEEPDLTTRAFWQSGQSLLLLEQEIAIDCPVRLLHGQADVVVPWSVALRIGEQLRSSDVQMLLVKDGDHRLSRESDLSLLVATLSTLLDSLS